MLSSTNKLLGKFRRVLQHQRLFIYSVRCVASSNVTSNDPDSNSVVFLRARDFGDRVAIVDSNGSHSYDRLLRLSQNIGSNLLKRTGRTDLSGHCVAFLCPNDVSYVAAQWAIWRHGGIAVPLCNSHPSNMYDYMIDDCSASIVISSDEYADKLEPIAKEKDVELMFLTEVNQDHQKTSGAKLTDVEKCEQSWDERDSMIIYTSGTTGRPKGVLLTHGNLRSQISSLVQAWEWNENDYIIHCLPLHHVHGIVNVLLCPLWVGATCHMLPKFTPDQVWDLLTGDEPRPSLFMAVPTIYSKLIQYHDKRNLSEQDKEIIKSKCEQLRLMVSGSAALPEPIMTRWQEITGHTLLERYGMTEIGMALSNPLHGSRLPGCVGIPLPGTEVRIMTQNVEGNSEVIVEGNNHGSVVSPGNEGKEGELQVRGPSVFKCGLLPDCHALLLSNSVEGYCVTGLRRRLSYWNKPEATINTFEDGWLKTGDTAVYKDGVYRILGRTSVDIIKSGGYKISALEVERYLLSHDHIKDCAVVGKPDPEWGERVAAIVTLSPGKKMSLADLKQWASGYMVPYQIPTVLLVVDELPRNTMGKVNKKELITMFFGKE